MADTGCLASEAIRAYNRAYVRDLLAVMGERIERVAWMGAETKAQALEKLDAFGVKIGYPDVWRDETALRVDRTNHAANLLRAWALAETGEIDPRPVLSFRSSSRNSSYSFSSSISTMRSIVSPGSDSSSWEVSS